MVENILYIVKNFYKSRENFLIIVENFPYVDNIYTCYYILIIFLIKIKTNKLYFIKDI